MSHEYLFYVTLLASIRVKAETPEKAAALLRDQVGYATASLGAWPNGDSILCEVSVEGDVDLSEVDGEPVDGGPL